MRRFTLAISILSLAAHAATPKLNLKLKNNSPIEQRKRAQIERLAAQYDLSKYTLTRIIAIEERAVAHSKPVLTLNGRFLQNDDCALSQYLHEQGHWVLTERDRRDNRRLYNDLLSAFPDINWEVPYGDGNQVSSYFHLAVILLEWQALEDLLGAERARAVMEFKKTDHYKDLYKLVLENRVRVESNLKRYGVKW